MTLCTFKHRKRICTYLSHVQKDYIMNMDNVRLSRNLYIHHVRLSTSKNLRRNTHDLSDFLALPFVQTCEDKRSISGVVSGLFCASIQFSPHLFMGDRSKYFLSSQKISANSFALACWPFDGQTTTTKGLEKRCSNRKTRNKRIC